MITRGFRNSYQVTCWDNPPPLLTHDPAYERAAWHPLVQVKDTLTSQHPGPEMVNIPAAGGNGLGDDPTNPVGCTKHRQTASPGPMVGFEIRVRGQAT